MWVGWGDWVVLSALDQVLLVIECSWSLVVVVFGLSL